MNVESVSQLGLFALVKDKRCWIVLVLGVFAGLPAALIASTLQAWFTSAGLNLHLIGGVTLLILPYSLRFFWAPLFDRALLPYFDIRRGWMLFLQCGLLICIVVMALISPTQMISHFPLLLIPGFILSILAASQEMVINAWQTEIFTSKERGLSAGLYVAGWRVGTIFSGGIALVLAGHYGWCRTYLMMALLMGLAPIVTWIAPSVRAKTYMHNDDLRPRKFLLVMINAVKDFFNRFGKKAAWMLLGLVLIFKIGDALTLSLNSAFLIRKMGFSLAVLGYVNKIISLGAAILGGIVGGIWMRYLPIYRAIVIFTLIQAASHVGYIILALSGKNLSILIFSAFIENFCSGMGTIALLALIMDLCNAKFLVTQLALFNAVAYLPRVFVGPIAALLVDYSGWIKFFEVCILTSLLPLILAIFVKNSLTSSENRENCTLGAVSTI